MLNGSKNKATEQNDSHRSPLLEKGGIIYHITLRLDRALGLFDDLITLEPVFSGSRKTQTDVGAKVKVLNPFDDRLSHINVGDVLYSINGLVVKTQRFTAIQGILHSCFRKIEDDKNYSPSTSVVALTFLRVGANQTNNIECRPGASNSSDSCVFISNEDQALSSVKLVRGCTSTFDSLSEPSLDRSLFDSVSYENSISFTREQVLHSIFSPGIQSFFPVVPLKNSSNALLTPNDETLSINCSNTPPTTSATSSDAAASVTTTKLPPATNLNSLASIPEYMLDTSRLSLSPSPLRVEDELKANDVQMNMISRCSSFDNPESPPTLISGKCLSKYPNAIGSFLTPAETEASASKSIDDDNSLSLNYSDTFLSPFSHIEQESSRPQTENVSIEMFNVDFLSSCHSRKILKAIVSNLSSPTKYPELKRLALNRLDEIKYSSYNEDYVESSIAADLALSSTNPVENYSALQRDSVDETFFASAVHSLSPSIKSSQSNDIFFIKNDSNETSARTNQYTPFIVSDPNFSQIQMLEGDSFLSLDHQNKVELRFTPSDTSGRKHPTSSIETDPYCISVKVQDDKSFLSTGCQSNQNVNLFSYAEETVSERGILPADQKRYTSLDEIDPDRSKVDSQEGDSFTFVDHQMKMKSTIDHTTGVLAEISARQDSQNHPIALNEIHSDCRSFEMYEDDSLSSDGHQAKTQMNFISDETAGVLKEKSAYKGDPKQQFSVPKKLHPFSLKNLNADVDSESDKENHPLHIMELKNECQECPRLSIQISRMEEDLATALAAHSEISSRLTEARTEREDIRKELSCQITNVMAKLKVVKAVLSNQKDAYSLKIAALERSKNIAEKNVLLLEEAMLESSSQSKAMKNQLLKTVKDLTLQISSERESSQRALTVALENQSELHKKVEHLTAKLALRERREAEMRRFLENDLQKKLKFVEDRSRTMAESLARDLKDTRKVVDSLTRENKELISAIEQLEHEHRNVLEFTEELTTAAAFETERSEKFALMHRNANLRALSAEKLAEAMIMELAQKDNALLESLEVRSTLLQYYLYCCFSIMRG